MSRKEMFTFGMEVFIVNVCRNNRDAYTQLMCQGSKDGYVEAVKAFHVATGILKDVERDRLFYNGIVPEFAANVFKMLENRYFGIDLFSHKH